MAMGICMKTAKHVTGLLLMTLLLASEISNHADAKQRFPLHLDSKVGHSVLATMLDASIAGNFYQIEPVISKVRFSVDSIAGEAEGKFNHFKGGIALQPDAGNNGQVVFVIKSGSVSTSNFTIDKVIKSKSYLDVKRYPEILFVSSGFVWLGETKGLLKGKLTLHGVTKAVAFNAELSDVKGNRVGNRETILVKINTSISRSMFGIKLMSSVVSDAVRLNMTIRAKKHSGVSKDQLVAMCSYSGI